VNAGENVCHPIFRRDFVYSVRSFLITLVASLLLFGVIAYYATGFVMDMVFRQEEETIPPITEVPDLPDEIGARGVVNLLLIVTDQYVYRPSPGGAVESQFNQLADAELRNHDTTIEFLTLVSFNSITRQVMVTALPGNLLVKANSAKLDLDSAYYFSQNNLYDLSSEYFVQSISALLGIQVDYSGYVDIDDYVRVADNLGGITVDCPEDVADIGITAGVQKLKSDQFYLMLTEDYFQDPANYTQFLINQCYAILNQITDEAHSETVYADWERISKVLKTDFTQSALSEYKDLIFSYSKFEVKLPVAIGKYETSGEEFYFDPDRLATQNLFKQYK
jgi:anionic cell wall polymer biosynthesis LytR-Cps2A-Psr (LCP) family protein